MDIYLKNELCNSVKCDISLMLVVI